MTDLNPRLQKLLWFVGLWIASILSLSVVAYGLRLVLGTAG